MNERCYSERLDQAVALVTRAFRNKRRKGTKIPYLSHLFQVMVYVAENGGDEDQLIAALLHDYLEDIDTATADEVRELFGERVTEMVAGLSDSTTTPKPPWPERKTAYLAALASKSAAIKLVSCSDKLHNARSIHRDFRNVGDALWDRFKADRDQTLWYYRGVVRALGTGWSHPLLDELRAEVRDLHARVGVPYRDE